MEGVARYIYETTKRMVENHPEDEFFFFFDRPYDTSFIFAENVTPVVISPPARHPILWKIWFDFSVPRYLKKYNIDVFYSGDTYMSLKTPVPTLLVCHDIAYAHYPIHIRKSHLAYYKNHFPRFHKKAKHVIAVSEFTKQDIISQYNLSEEKVSVGYNATPNGFRPHSIEEIQEIRQKLTQGAPYFIYVGSLHPRKNVVNLIKAFDLFKKSSDSDHKLVLVGRMAWKNKELNQVQKTLSYADDIILTGHLSGELHPYMAAASALTYVSVFEGFGIPILEGMASGIPVITSNVSSLPEVAKDAAILIDPTDIHQIAQAMEDVTTNDDLRSDLIKKGFERIRFFSWTKTANHIYQKLNEIVRN